METFLSPKHLVADPRFAEERRKSQAKLDLGSIDPPIVPLMSGFMQLPWCFTLQSCYGHFLHAGQDNPRNTERLPELSDGESVEYRIAYLALCVENSLLGRSLLQELEVVPDLDPGYVQFGSAAWFWRRRVNTYALQVEPRRFMTRDQACFGYREALHVERVRDEFFSRLTDLVTRQLQQTGWSSWP